MDFRANNAAGSPHSVGSHGSPIPISGERNSASASRATISKRPRLAPISSDHLGDSHIHATHTPGTNAAGVSAATFPFRLEVDLPPFPPSNHLGSLSTTLSHSHATPHPSLTGLYASAHSSNGMMNSQSAPPFIPQPPFDFTRHQPPPTLRSVTFPSQSYGQQPQYSQHRPSPQHVQSSNMFVELLSATPDGHGSSQPQFSSFDWPVHSQQSHPPRHDPGTLLEKPFCSNSHGFLVLSGAFFCFRRCE